MLLGVRVGGSCLNESKNELLWFNLGMKLRLRRRLGGGDGFVVEMLVSLGRRLIWYFVLPI